MLCRQVYHDSDEGKRYSQFYKIDAMPYTAIIDPVTGDVVTPDDTAFLLAVVCVPSTALL